MKIENIIEDIEQSKSERKINNKNEMSLQINYKKVSLIILLILFLFITSSSVKGAIYYGKGPSLIENKTWYQNFTNVSRGSLNLGDIDNDGDLDLVLTGRTATAKIYKNNGTSFRENITWQQDLQGVYYSSTALGDIDNDGDLDLVLTGCAEGGSDNCPAGAKYTKIYENNGTSFHENTTWQQNLTDVYFGAVAFGDIDNDGDLDLFLTGRNYTRISKIYLNNGTSFVESVQWYQNLTALVESAAVFGDIDNDADLDLVLTGDVTAATKISKVYLNNGTSLVESEQWYTNLRKVDQGTLVLMDFDNDGDLDLDLTGCCDYNRLYVNNGTSFVLNISEQDEIGGIATSFEGSVSWGDYDNDGDLDTAVTGREGKSFVYNNNNTQFQRARYVIALHDLYYSTIVWGDVDNDSDLDIIQTGARKTLPMANADVYNNNITTPNNKPSHPNQFTNYTTTKGNIHLGWSNGSDNETPSNGLYYNLRLGSTSAGNQIITGKYGGGEDNGYFGNMMQRKNFTLKSDRLSSNTQYFWSVQTIDTGLKTSNWSAEQTFTTQADLTPPTITATKPNNYFNISQANITFNITAYDNVNISNITIYGNWTNSWHINATNSSALNNSNHLFTNNLTAYGDGFYLWNTRACDNSSLCTFAQNKTFLIDTTYPYINLISPANSSTLTSPTIPFQYNVSDQRISNCTLIIDSSIDQTNHSTRINTTETFYKTLANKNYNWSINCTDQLNQRNFSKTYQLTVNYQPVQPTTGGISSRAGKRAQLTPTKQLVPKEPKPKKIQIKEEHLEEIKIPKKEIPKSKLINFFETILAFIISIFIILSYVWIIKEDFKR